MMAGAFAAIGPLFSVLAIGGLASFLPKMRTVHSALTTFVFYLALPAFLFDAVVSAPVNEGVPWAFILTACGVTSSVAVLSWIVGMLTGATGRKIAAPLALAASYGNVGYLGVPIALSTLGPEAGLAAAIGQLLHNLLFMLGYPTVRAFSSRLSKDSGAGTKVWIAVKKALLTSPISLSVALGITIALIEVPLPTLVSDTLGLFSQTAVPLAMFAVGLTLPTAVKDLMKGTIPGIPLLAGTAMKMFVLPVCTAVAVAQFAPSLEPAWSGTLILMAAMPTSTTAFILSQQEDPDPTITASMIAVTSTLGIVSIPLTLTYFVL